MGRNDIAQKRFYLIVGCPRSGTYLLSTMLQAHFRIGVPVETHFMPFYYMIRGLFGDLKKSRNRERLLKCIYDFLAIWTPRAERGRNSAVIRNYSLLSTKDCADEILQDSNTYSDLVNKLFNIYSKKHSMNAVGDKSAFFSRMPLEMFDRIIPGMKVIHIVRDGRDASLSWMKIWTGPRTLAVAAREWRNHVIGNREWGKRHPEKYFEVHYEDLLDDKDSVMKKIGNFVDLPYDPDAIPASSELSNALAGGETHPLLSKPVDKSNKEKWRKILSSSERQLFEYIAGDALVDSGYETIEEHLPFYRKVWLNCKIMSARLRDGITFRNIQLQLKAVLPLVLWICDKLNIPAVQLLNGRRYRDYLIP